MLGWHMMYSNVEELIRRYVNFRHGVAGGGWNVVYCEVCGDGSRTKGPRGGFTFNEGGEACSYHCFNCGCKESFSINREYPFSKGMRNVFESFGIEEREYNSLLLKKGTATAQAKPKVQTHTIIEIPDYFKLLTELSSDEVKDYREFLKTEYALTIKSYSFYCSTGVTSSNIPKVINECKTLAGRLIIPYYKNGKMIYYQGRDITNKSKLKYLSPDLPKANILFNIDQLYRNTNEPLYVLEGAPDAIHLNGVATLGNELTSAQKTLLEGSRRRKVLVPDFKGDSNKLIDDFIDMGWDVSLPSYHKKFKDPSEAIVNYGKLYVAWDIVNNTKTADEAKVLLPFLNLK